MEKTCRIQVKVGFIVYIWKILTLKLLWYSYLPLLIRSLTSRVYLKCARKEVWESVPICWLSSLLSSSSSPSPSLSWWSSKLFRSANLFLHPVAITHNVAPFSELCVFIDHFHPIQLILAGTFVVVLPAGKISDEKQTFQLNRILFFHNGPIWNRDTIPNSFFLSSIIDVQFGQEICNFLCFLHSSVHKFLFRKLLTKPHNHETHCQWTFSFKSNICSW